MTHKEIIVLRNDLDKTSGIKSDETNYAIEENRERLNVAIKPLVKQEADINAIIKDFNEESKVLKEKFGTVNGEIRMKVELRGIEVIESIDIPEELKAEYVLKLNELKEKYAEQIAEYKERVTKYIIFIETTESPVVLYMLKWEHIPKDISTENMRAIFKFVTKKEQ